MLRIMVTPRMSCGAGLCGCCIEPGRTTTSSRARSTPSLSRHRRAHQEVDRARHLVVAGAGVERDALAVDLQAIAQLDGSVALAVAVDGVREVVAALREKRPQLAAQLGLGLRDQRVEGSPRRGGAEAL
jgi:hypothetical protein